MKPAQPSAAFPMTEPAIPIQEDSSGVTARNPAKPIIQTNDDEYRLIEEACTVTAPMSGFLDNGEEQKAICEARKLLEHPNREVRMAVVQSLDWIGLPAAMELAKMIDDSDAEIRSNAQDAFWRALDDADNPGLKRDLLAEALHSNEPDVRTKVLEELIFLPDNLSFETIASALNDPDEAIAELAREKALFVSGEEFETLGQAMKWFAENKNLLESE
ncbi:MAG: HEAT repeat domain-containing protein [Pontiellaceae bacterium]|nr:HEAT repeat domain-containing protein [Pontiellaceae bacterium]